MDPFDVREWLAPYLGCQPGELEITTRERTRFGGWDIYYSRAGVDAARVVLSGRRRRLGPDPDGRIVQAIWDEGGATSTEILADRAIIP